jgi:hypothetical protein
MTAYDLAQANLRSGENHHVRLEIDLPPLEFAGQHYEPLRDPVPAELLISRTRSGTVIALAFTASLEVPCYECLENSLFDLPIQSREFVANAAGSRYVEEGRLEISRWARDALADALSEFAGYRGNVGPCPVCGSARDDEPVIHEERPSEQRWAALETVKGNIS